jgi:apolipoprotein N-acyltransferase
MLNRLALPLAFVAGCLAALGFAPLDLWPVALAGLAGLLFLVSRARGVRAAAGMGWLFGIGMFAVSLNWIATAFTFQAKMPPALGWVAVVGLAMYLALFVAVPAGLAALLRTPSARMLGLAALWIPAEWARGIVLTGFAWNPLGAIWLPVTGVAQLAASIGAIGLSLLALIAAVGLVWLVAGPQRLARVGGGGVLLGISVAGLIGNSAIIESGFLGAPLVVVQSGIGQGERYDAAAMERHLDTYLDLTRTALVRVEATQRSDLPDVTIKDTRIGEAEGIDTPLRPGVGKVTGDLQNSMAPGLTVPPSSEIGGRSASSLDLLTADPEADADAAANPNGDRQIARRAPPRTTPALVVWPEGAIDGLIEEDAATRARIADVLRAGDLLLAGGTGISRVGGEARYANSLFVLDSEGRIRGRYDKAHLVPLGEHVPWRHVLEPLGIARLVPGDGDFARGPGPRTLELPGFLGVSPVICYEIAFPQAVVQDTPRPAWIANISNDAWFGAWGPPQHVAQARLRAIEEGLPIARATPTGHTVVIDGHGRVLNQLQDGVPDSIVTTMPPPLPAPPFTRGGPALALLGALVLAALALLVQQQGAGRPEFG